MPKIDASSVKKHREIMSAKLLDVAEALLADGGVDALTASAVTTEVGIARNSLYRYVSSIDDLRGKVVARYLPGWTSAVQRAVDAADGAMSRLLAYVASNLEEAAVSGHGWLMKIAKGLPPAALADVADAHRSLRSMLVEQCRAVDPEGYVMTAALVQAVLEAGFARLDAGDALDVVRPRCVAAVKAIVESQGS